jgi:hypothetical protein
LKIFEENFGELLIFNQIWKKKHQDQQKEKIKNMATPSIELAPTGS